MTATPHPIGLLDTRTVILLPRLSTAEVLPERPVISAITLAELSVGPLAARDEGERSRRLAHLQQAESDFTPVPFDPASARAFGRLRPRCASPGARPRHALTTR